MNGSPYGDRRGKIDEAMAGVGLASGLGGLGSSLGLFTLGPVGAAAVVGGGTAAGLWGLGNLGVDAYDHAEEWNENVDDWGRGANQWMSEKGGAVGDWAGDIVEEQADLHGNEFLGYRDAVDTVLGFADEQGNVDQTFQNPVTNNMITPEKLATLQGG
ncbi:hypothetical protein [Brevibacterium samyangense]